MHKGLTTQVGSLLARGWRAYSKAIQRVNSLRAGPLSTGSEWIRAIALLVD